MICKNNTFVSVSISFISLISFPFILHGLFVPLNSSYSGYPVFVSLLYYDLMRSLFLINYVNELILVPLWLKRQGQKSKWYIQRSVHKRYYDTGKDGVTAEIKLMVSWQHHHAMAWNGLQAVYVEESTLG